MAVRVQLTGDGLNYDTEATLVQAAKIIGFLNTEEVLPDAPTRATATGGFIDEPIVMQVSSPREAILSSGAKTNAQKILVLGAYIAQRDNTDVFASSELKTLFVKAGEPAPRNLSRDIRDAVKAGYITESFDTSDSFIVTNTGYSALQRGFTSESTHIKHGRTRKRSTIGKPQKTSETPEWLEGVAIDDQMNGFPSYRQMKTRSDKVLWIAQWAAQHNRDRVNSADVSAIANKLADHIPRNQMAAAYSTHLTRGNVSKTSEGYKVLYTGTEYLKSGLGSEE